VEIDMLTPESDKPIASARPPNRLDGRLLSSLLRLAERPFWAVGAALVERRAREAELSELQAAVTKFGAENVPVSVRRIVEYAVRDVNDDHEISWPAATGDAKRLASWLDQSAGIDLTADQRDRRHRMLNNALRSAAAGGHTACVELLMPHCDPSAADEQGRDALMQAAGNGQAACVAALLPWANPLRISASGQTALTRAVRAESVDCVKLLAPHSDARVVDEGGYTALMLAAESGSAECVRLLLPHSDVAAVDPIGYTALMVATIYNNPDCVAALLPASDPNARKRLGDSAMAIAIRQGHAECADLMAPRAEREAVEEAFRKFGSAGMPRWHAQIEAKALRETLRGCASNEAHTNHGAGLCSGGEPRVGDQTPQRTRPRGAAKRL
jgi:ankyrin repeat protein